MLLVLSSLWGAAGGIPAFNQLLTRAAAEFVTERGRSLQIIALTDADDAAVPAQWLEQLPAAARPPGFYQRCAGDRGRCVRSVLWELPRRRVIVFGHVNLAPLGLLLPRYGVVAHGTEVWTRLPTLRRAALRRATAIGCVSDHTAAQVQRIQGVAAERCARLVNALPLLPKEPAAAGEEQALSGQGRPVRVLSVTRLHPAEPKGIDLMLHALAALPEVEYTVVGTGAALPSLQRLAVELGVAARVRFTGQLDDAERDAELKRCDVFALPSRGEGFGIVYLEAMAYGKPCLAAQAGGAPEVVLDGETGLVVEPAIEPVRSALQRLVVSAPLRQRLGRAGRERVAQCFGYAQFRDRAARFFARLEE
jgi:glycosyltransferase involved in cell wall biosynthesis